MEAAEFRDISKKMCQVLLWMINFEAQLRPLMHFELWCHTSGDEYKHGLGVPKSHIHVPEVYTTMLGVWYTPSCQ